MAGSALDGYDDELTTAKDLRIKPRTLRKWRATGLGPPFTKVGRRYYYSRAGRVAWLKANEKMPVRSERAA